MSESNAPLNRSGQFQSGESAPDWENPFADIAEDMDLQGGSSLENLLFEMDLAGSDWEAYPQTLEQLSDGLAKGLAIGPLANAAPAPIAPSSAAAARPEAPTEPAITEPATSEPTDISDLVSLVQELNQCNSILLDRVSQLEEALESSQVALQAEVGRSQEFPLTPASVSSPLNSQSAHLSPEAQVSTQDQVVALFNQLEFAHQTSQRQQILVETLTEQLESSQERVAELEREAALVQQRYNDQAQAIALGEMTNRDLQARLHRQQRYTLQFKSALEKCLEVPAPQYDLGDASISFSAEDNPFLPKIQQIQPWSAEASKAQAPWMKLYPGSLVDTLTDNVPDGVLADEVLADAVLADEVRAAVELPGQALNQTDPNALSEVAQSEVVQPAELPVERSVAQPVYQSASERLAVEMTAASEVAKAADFVPEGSVVLPLADTNFIDSPTHAEILPNASDASTSATLSDADDLLWQDLARLIEVSTEDVVRASLSGDFSAFEAIDFDAVAPGDTALAVEAASAEPLAGELKESAENSESDQSFIPGLAQPNWPSPVVHPLRPAKKQRSPGKVDLPSFLRPDANPLTT